MPLSADSEYLHYSSFSASGYSLPFYPFHLMGSDSITGEDFAFNSSKFMGNACLVCNNDIQLAGYSLSVSNAQLVAPTLATPNTNHFLKYAPCYWAENRPYVKLYKNDTTVPYAVNLLYGTNDLNYDEDQIGSFVSWPSSGESNYYWSELDLSALSYDNGSTKGNVKASSNMTNGYQMFLKTPSGWGKIFGKDSYWKGWAKNSYVKYGWKAMDYFPRHPGSLNNYSFLLTIRVYSIDVLASLTNSIAEDFDFEGSTTADNSYITSISLEGKTIATFEIMKIDDETEQAVESGS